MSRKEGYLANEDKQDEKRKRDKLRAEQATADLQWLLGHSQGRRWFYRLVYGVCGVEDGIWEASAAIHFREGRRSIGIDVKNEAQAACPALYLSMIQEQMIEAQKRTNAKENDDE
jgi:hypothetical protein